MSAAVGPLSAPRPMLHCLLIADDLTGACDAAVRFAAAGLRTVVPLSDADFGAADVVAISTESRDVDPAEARRRLCRAAEIARRLAPRVLFKKIDSTLRGNTGHEIVAALDAFGCDAAVVNPAFPAMGRVVQGGYLRITHDRSFAPVEMAAYLAAHGAAPARFLTPDASCDADLDGIAARLLTADRRILCAGSAGLAGALAARLGTNAAPSAEPCRHGPVLFCIGSDHPVTVEQQRRLLEQRDAADALLWIPRGRMDESEIRARIGGRRPAAFFLCGGDTASLVCRALAVERIEIEGELAPGIPLGTLCGGAYDGVSVVTKSGGFGPPDALVKIMDTFHG